MSVEVQSAIERLYREEFGRIVPTLIRVLGDFAAAEEAVHEAFAAALERWPEEGIPQVPRAWVVQVAKHRAIDRVRARQTSEDRREELEVLGRMEQELAALPDDPPTIGDDQLRLLYTCCHPALAPEVQVALALRTLCGLTTDEIARAFLIPSATLAQRIVRGQKKIALTQIPFQVPEEGDLIDRTTAVMVTLYLVFNEGYAATRGQELLRVDLCEEAIRLARVLCTLPHQDPSVGALLALMLLHHARRRARIADDGGLVLLDQQDRSLWDRAEIDEGIRLLDCALKSGARGPYAIQAAIAALHAQAETSAATDWNQIVGLYDELFRQDPSPVVALNRAAAVAMAHGAERGLAQIDDLDAQGQLAQYHLLPAARADLLRRLGRHQEAMRAYEKALSLTQNEPERRFIETRLAELKKLTT